MMIDIRNMHVLTGTCERKTNNADTNTIFVVLFTPIIIIVVVLLAVLIIIIFVVGIKVKTHILLSVSVKRAGHNNKSLVIMTLVIMAGSLSPMHALNCTSLTSHFVLHKLL